MARQSGPVFIEGTLEDLTFYKMDGNYYVRMKSSLSRKKVLESPRFVNTRRHASQLAEASKITSQVYRSLPKEQRDYKLFRVIVGKAKVLLSSGKDKEDVFQLLMNELFPQKKMIKPKERIKSIEEKRDYVTERGRLVWKISDNSLKKTINGMQLTNNFETYTMRESNFNNHSLFCHSDPRFSEVEESKTL